MKPTSVRATETRQHAARTVEGDGHRSTAPRTDRPRDPQLDSASDGNPDRDTAAVDDPVSSPEAAEADDRRSAPPDQ